MHRSIVRRTARVALLLLVPQAAAIAAAPSHARSHSAPTLIGTVRDTSGAPLANVQLVVAEVGRVTTTDAEGTYSIRGLPAGTYHLNAFLIGYAPAHVTATVPAEGEDVRVDITMRPTPLRLSGVVVTASPVGTDPLNITQSTIELSGKDLARNLGSSVAQTLASEPGMSMRYNGPMANTPVIRGLSGERILVLQDGERTGDLSSPSADHALTVDPIAAQRVEVVRGPASLLYGNNALGGVVNVISNDIPTAVPTHIEGYVGSQFESVNPGGAVSASVTIPSGSRAALSVRGGLRRIDDVRVGGGGTLANTDSRNANGLLGVGYIGETLTGGFSYRLLDFEYGLPSPPEADEAGIRLDGRRQDVTGRATFDLPSPQLTFLRVDGTAQWYEHDEIEPGGEVGTRFSLRTQTLNATAKTQFGSLNGALGVQGLFKQYEATGEEALTPAADSRSGGVFVYEELPFGEPTATEDRRPRLQLGARYDYYQIDSKQGDDKFGPARSLSFNNVSGSLGASVPVGGSATLSASVARAFRAPTVEELFSNAFHAATGAYEIGDPSLDAETNAGFDAVLRVQSGRTFGQLSGFYNRINDYIAPTPVGDTLTDEGDVVPLARYSQADAELRGLEAQVEAQVARSFVLGAMGDLVRGSYRGGGNLPFMPASRVGGSARWDDGRFSLGTEVRHAFQQDRVTENELATDAYTLVNVTVALNLVSRGFAHSITLRADNLFDEEYRDATSRIKEFAPNPGRNISLVYRVLF